MNHDGPRLASEFLQHLPPAGSDEPAALRRDIAAELADHLACSARRELVLGADERTAWRRAHAKLGDVKQLARRLWWLAMRERIMNQRGLLIGQWVLAACGLAVVFLLWQANAAQQRMLAEQQAQLARLVERLGRPAVAPPPPAETPPAEQRLQVLVRQAVAGSETTRPVDMEVAVNGTYLTNREVKGSKMIDGRTGIADFGPIPPGEYALTLSGWPDGPDSRLWTSTRRRTVVAGKDHLEKVFFPPLGEGRPVTPAIGAGEDVRAWMKSNYLVLATRLRPLPLRHGEDLWQSDHQIYLLVASDGRTMGDVRPNYDSVFVSNIPTRNTHLWGLADESRTPFDDTGKPATACEGVRYRAEWQALVTDPRYYNKQRGEWRDVPGVVAVELTAERAPADPSFQAIHDGGGEPWLLAPRNA